GCMRTYLILREKARRWSADDQVRRILKQVARPSKDLDSLWGTYSRAHAETLLGMTFDRVAMASRTLPYERLDQRTMEILLGVD
ncbi:MAG TPA: hypothetical protein PKU91_01525, partial [Phycisphaerales bacterium]|nr:hypothetical protein [Phycisphaerales bacterium]